MTVRVQSEAFDSGVVLANFAKDRADVGAIVSFTGIVRNSHGDLDHMLIEHYPGMTERAIGGLVDQAVSRWALADALVIHRYGQLAPGAPIMMVATAAGHRADAFAAADFLMDYLKSRAPFWKKEVSRSGAVWVAAKDDDEQALKRW